MLTEEQRQIIEETTSNPDGIYGIHAVAGSGKSFTIFKAIEHIKQVEPDAKILYLVFNKANEIEATRKIQNLPGYLSWENKPEARTAHSFACKRWKLRRPMFKPIESLDWGIISECKAEFYDRHIRYSKKAPFVWLHNKFIASKLGLTKFCEDMLFKFDDTYEGPDKAKECEIIGPKNRKDKVIGLPVDGYSCVTKNHIKVFKDVIKAHENFDGTYKDGTYCKGLYTHGMYLKAAAYDTSSKPVSYDYVFFDEAQDASKFMLMLLDNQNVRKKYFVGDERQSIYNFNGSSENVFDTLTFSKTYPLSKSFRFGGAVAKLANAIIGIDSDHEVFGTEQEHPTDTTHFARLYRTNAKLFLDALELAYAAEKAGRNIKISFMRQNSEDNNAENELLGFLKLYYSCSNPGLLREYSQFFPDRTPQSLQMFESALQEERRINTPLRAFLNVYNDHYDLLSDDIHQMFEYAKQDDDFVAKYKALQRCLECIVPEQVIIMITMHRSKGLEFDNVVIAEPTKLYYKDKNGTIRKNSNYMQELNLAYVACTRARKNLDATILFHELDTYYRETKGKSFNEDLLIIVEGKNYERTTESVHAIQSEDVQCV